MPVFSKAEPSKSARTGIPVQSLNLPEVKKTEIMDHPSHRPLTPRVSGRDAFATPSISGALRESAAIHEKESFYVQDKSSSGTKIKNNSFSREELTKVWKRYVEKIEAPQLKSALSIKEPMLREKWNVEYELDNELQLQRLTLDIKPKLLGWLREHLNNESIDINFTISPNQETGTSVPYTESEKWQTLVDKYPSLASLKSKFGLDFE